MLKSPVYYRRKPKMRIITHSVRIVGSSIFLALVIAATGCRSSGDRSAGQTINDKMTSFNVGHALGTDSVFKYPDVQVHVYNGSAQLSGFTDTEEQRTRAAQIASGVQGVREVINEITLKPQPTGRAAIRDTTTAPAPEPAPTAPPPPR
jgi:hypothetical protein